MSAPHEHPWPEPFCDACWDYWGAVEESEWPLVEVETVPAPAEGWDW